MTTGLGQFCKLREKIVAELMPVSLPVPYPEIM